MGRIIDDVFAKTDAFLLGRRTYDIFAAYWPRVTDPNDPVAAALNRLPKYVVSRTLDKVEWHNSTLLRGDVPKQVAELKRRHERDILIQGSSELLQTLLANDLVDEYRLLTFPVVLGSGKRLFGTGAVPSALTLVDTRATSAGVVVNTYRPAGKPTYGSFALDQ
jgi:dihydrofolate reductase